MSTLKRHADSLPEYRVKESARAKHVRLKVSPKEGLVVTVPKGFDHARLPDMLRERKAWLDKHLGRIEEHKALTRSQADILPEQITLHAVGKTRYVDYKQTKAKTVSAQNQGEDRLLVRGDIADKDKVHAALHRWLIRQTHAELVPWLESLSKQHCLSYNKALVKSQKTRWAGCSKLKNISVNYKLLFLPPHLVRYVFLHELCHTVFLNHSQQFWALLAGVEAQCRMLDEELRESWKWLPTWIK